MSYSTRIERTRGNRLIEPGATWTEPLQQLQFQVVIVCDAVGPDRWHAEVRFGRHVLISTPQVDSDDQASRLAREAFEAKVVELFRMD